MNHVVLGSPGSHDASAGFRGFAATIEATATKNFFKEGQPQLHVGNKAPWVFSEYPSLSGRNFRFGSLPNQMGPTAT